MGILKKIGPANKAILLSTVFCNKLFFSFVKVIKLWDKSMWMFTALPSRGRRDIRYYNLAANDFLLIIITRCNETSRTLS